MQAVVLAGGKGTRLAPYTTAFPKALVPVGDMPILEIALRQLSHFGIRDITIAVGHLAELIMAYFGDGERLGLRIRYSREQLPLGTAGPLTLIDGLDQPFMVLNGDLLTNLDFRRFIEHHTKSGASATVATYKRDVQSEFGMLTVDETGDVIDYQEKPTYSYLVSMGIYVMQPSILGLLERGQRCDLPDLVLRLLAGGERVAAYQFAGYWLDVGRPGDYEQAIAEFGQRRGELLHEED